jgi:glycosyltransferase involved in cell wall biosynthesis
VTGAHVPPRDPAALAAALADLLGNPDRRAALGAAGVQRARRHFAHDRVAPATRDVYTEVVRTHGAAAGTRFVRSRQLREVDA